MTAYEISEPPAGSRCGTTWCGNAATVRTASQGTTASRAGNGDLAALEKFGLCWDVLRGQLVRAGHTITDTTGGVERLRAEFCGFRVFRSGGHQSRRHSVQVSRYRLNRISHASALRSPRHRARHLTPMSLPRNWSKR